MSEEPVSYNTLLQRSDNRATMEEESAPVDWSKLERMLLPLLNLARQMQGKRPVIVPK